MVVALITKGPLLYPDDATLNAGMDPLDKIVSNSFADSLDEERSKKIALLKKAVADGTYHVSHERLADKLLEHMLEPKASL